MNTQNPTPHPPARTHLSVRRDELLLLLQEDSDHRAIMAELHQQLPRQWSRAEHEALLTAIDQMIEETTNPDDYYSSLVDSLIDDIAGYEYDLHKAAQAPPLDPKTPAWKRAHGDVCGLTPDEAKYIRILMERFNCTEAELQDQLHDLHKGRSHMEWAFDFLEVFSKARNERNRKLREQKDKEAKKQRDKVAAEKAAKAKAKAKAKKPAAKSHPIPRKAILPKKSPRPAAPSAVKKSAPSVRKPNAAFNANVTFSKEIAAIIGSDKPRPRVQITKEIWEYIKTNKCQDQTNKRMLNCDEKLKALFGADTISIVEMGKIIEKHIIR